HELLVRQVAGGAEDDERAGIGRLAQGEALGERVLRLRRLLGGLRHCSGLFSRWPPKAWRIAERTRSPKSASPREAKRLNSDAASTGAGTPSSTAACTVHRPSPESLTRPAYSSSSGVSCSACAVRSSSHEEITDPRRQSSVTAAMSRSYMYRSGSRSGVVSASVSCACLPTFACLRTFRPSAYACIRPYSMPLWTIFTKCPAPDGPQWSQPCSSGVGSPARPGVRGAEST